MLVAAHRHYRTARGDVVVKLDRRERDYGPHGPPDSHPWLATLMTTGGAHVQQWYTRDGRWTNGSKSELDLVELK